MSNTRPSRFSRPDAERMLGAAAGDRRAGSDPLASVLAAAAAPPRDAEYAGEDAAMTAFLAEHLAGVDQSRRGQMIKSPLAKLLTLKAGALALTLSAGGVALAASTGAFHPAAHVHVRIHGPASAAGSHESIGARAAARASVKGAQAGASAAGRVSTRPLTRTLSALDAAKACHMLASKAYATGAHANAATVQVLTETGLQNALASTMLNQVIVNNPEFASLVATAQGQTNVADYCGLLLHLTKLPAPGSLAKLPASVLAGIPTSVLSGLPASVLSGVPAAELSRLPVAFLIRLPAGVLSGLPVAVLTGLLPKLPAATLAHLPVRTLSGMLAKLPAKVLGGVLAKLPAGVLSQVLPLLPSSLLTGLPGSILSRLP